MGSKLKNNMGFSLTELMIVVAIGGVVSALAFPNLFSQLPKWKTDGVARAISGKLMQARLRAIQENKDYGVKFTFGAVDKFKIQTDTGSWVDVGDESQSGPVNLDVKGTCPDDRVEFYPNGTAGSCNSIRIISADNAWDRRITLSTTTGKITLKECDVEVCGAW